MRHKDHPQLDRFQRADSPVDGSRFGAPHGSRAEVHQIDHVVGDDGSRRSRAVRVGGRVSRSQEHDLGAIRYDCRWLFAGGGPRVWDSGDDDPPDCYRRSDPAAHVELRSDDRRHLARELLPATVAADPDNQSAELALLRLATVTAAERQKCRIQGNVPVDLDPLVLRQVGE